MISSGWERFVDMTCLLREDGPPLLCHWTNFRGHGHTARVPEGQLAVLGNGMRGIHNAERSEQGDGMGIAPRYAPMLVVFGGTGREIYGATRGKANLLQLPLLESIDFQFRLDMFFRCAG